MELDALVRRADEDRWLASRFAPESTRNKLVAIYALNHEIARISETVREPGVGAIRLAWWRDAIAGIHAGEAAPDHPVARAYADSCGSLPGAVWSDLIAARAKDFEASPFADWADAERYVDDTAGAVLQLALAACAIDAETAGAPAPFARAAARAWGYLGLARVVPRWSARGRSLPDVSEMRVRARAAYEQAQQFGRGLPARLWPAFGYVALTAMYLRAAEPALLARQARLVWSSATGRL